jgi:hypothetical protein
MCEPSATAQFWLDWGIQVAAAIATLAAVFVALFGQAFRSKFFPPQLSLRIAEAAGEKTRVTLRWVEGNTEHQRLEDARYYRIHVTNARRWSPANQVHVTLLQVEEPSADGQFTVSWVGDAPLVWMHQPVLPVLRTVGPVAQADLCSVVKDKWFQLHPLIPPSNLDVTRRSTTRMILSVQARSNEIDSSVLRLAVSWDGQWHDGSLEMQTHFTVKVLDDSVA